MERKTSQLAFDYGEVGEAHPSLGEGTQAAAALPRKVALAQDLIEAMVSPPNMRRALKRVKSNKGSPGADGMTVNDLDGYLKEHWLNIRAGLLEGDYRPQAVRRVEIPKPDGGTRQLGVPTVLDRLIQQALTQVLEPIYDPTFSNSSYGFRPGRNAHQAVKAARDYVAKGKRWVVDLDLEKFFDRMNHDILLSRLAQRVGDKRALRLIRAFLNAGVMANGIVIERREGTPQGGPLSPLLANILLDELDKELEKRGHSFCRYADDCNIYVASERAGERVMASVTQYLERKLRLKVNQTKSGVAKPRERKFLGLRILGGEKARISVAPKSLLRFKKNVRRMTRRNRGISLTQMILELNQATMGWVNYFAIAEAKTIFQELDGWIRRRLRCFIWKQWKKAKTRMRHLTKAGVGPWLAWGLVNGGHGPWSVSRHAAMQRAASTNYLQEQGYQSLYDRYIALTSY